VTYADTKAAIVTHAAAAGGALSDPILDARAAFPVPKGRCIRVYYGGEAEPVRMGGKRVLNAELVAQRTIIAAFFPIALNDEDVAAQIDADLQALAHDLRTRILGDSQLGGAQTDLELGYVEPDIVLNGNTRYLVGIWEVLSDFTEYALAP